MARPTKLTPEVQLEICNWLKLGYYQEDAAIMAGISASTYYEWMKKGELERVALEEGEKAGPSRGRLTCGHSVYKTTFYS